MSDEGAPILIVDDEPDICWALGQVLKRAACLTVRAGDGREALGVAERTPLRMAFVDAKLPDVEGIDLVTRLREMQPGLRVVLISGYFYEDDSKVQEWASGGLIHGFISKPFLHQEVRHMVSSVGA